MQKKRELLEKLKFRYSLLEESYEKEVTKAAIERISRELSNYYKNNNEIEESTKVLLIGNSEEVISKIGVLAFIFGGDTFEIKFNLKTFKVKFKEITKRSHIKDLSFLSVLTDIYEEDRLVISNIDFTFNRFSNGDLLCESIDFSWWDDTIVFDEHYNYNAAWAKYVGYAMAHRWNEYENVTKRILLENK